MPSKIVKKIVNKLQTKHAKVIDLIKRYPAVSLASAILAVLIGCGNPFVVGAILGGFLGAKQIEDFKRQHETHDLQMISTVITNAMLGGLVIVCTVLFGAHLGSIGLLLGSIAGVVVTALFIGRASELIVAKIISYNCRLKSPRTKKYSH